MAGSNEGQAVDESGKNDSVADAALLADASRIAAEAAQGLMDTGWTQDWVALLKALASITSEQATHGNPRPIITAERLREAMAEIVPKEKHLWLRMGNVDPNTTNKKFTKAVTSLRDNLQSVDTNLETRAIKARVPAKISLIENQIDGRTKGYGLETVPLARPLPVIEPNMLSEQKDTDHQEPANTVSSPVAVEYLVEMDVYPLPRLKKPFRVPLRRTAGIALLVLGIVTIALCMAAGWAILWLLLSPLPLRQILQLIILICMVGGMYGGVIWPIYWLLENDIVMAPTLLQVFVPENHVLQIVREDAGRTVRMLRYTATCPLCGGTITINQGHGTYRGRFVGRCEKNRLEHVFSFDHVLKTGRLLT